MKSKRFGWCVALVAIAVMSQVVVPVEAQEDNRYFDQVSYGYWTNANHWDTGVVPATTSKVYIGSISTTCIVDTAGQQCSRLYLGNGSDTISQLDLTGGGLTINYGNADWSFFAGYSATGILNQTGGTLDALNVNFRIGALSTGVGTVNFSGGTLANVNSIKCGDSGHGTINVSDGVFGPFASASYVGINNVGIVDISDGTWDNGDNSMNIGDQAGGTGTVNVTGGAITNMATIYVGNYGRGTLNVSGAAVVDCVRIYPGFRADATSIGEFSISGSAATFNVEQFRGSNPGTATLRLTPDATGITPINVFYDGADGNSGKAWVTTVALVVDFSNYDSTEDLIVMTCDTAFTGPFASTTWLPEGRTATVTESGGVVRVTDISGPLGTLISVR